MNLSIKALLPEEEKPVEEVKAKVDEEPVEEELREWKDAEDSGVSIADMLNQDK